MAKAKFERTKPHVNIVLSVTLTMVKLLLLQQSLKFLLKKVRLNSKITA